MNEGTVRGSLAGVAARFTNQADRAQAFMTGGMSYDDRVKNYMARHPAHRSAAPVPCKRCKPA